VYFIRVLAGTSAGYPNVTDNQWPWVSHTTIPLNGGTESKLS